MVHVGKKIEEVLRERHIPVIEFARRINTNRNNVYSIFRRESIDTKLLQKVGEVLQYNFFLFVSITLYGQTKMENVNSEEMQRKYDLDVADKIDKLQERLSKAEEENALLRERRKGRGVVHPARPG